MSDPVFFGHTVPPFREVFSRILRSGMQEMSVEQVVRAAEALTALQRSAAADWLGEAGMEAVLEGLDDARRGAVRERWTAGGGITEEGFRREYPAILNAVLGALPAEQVNRTLDRLTGEDLASQSLFLGHEGRRALFGGMPSDRVRAVLERTEDWVFLATGKQAAEGIRGMTATLEKQERVGGKLQDQETIELKLRTSPRGVYMRWIAGPFKGRELLYSEAHLGRADLRVREGGLLGVIPVTIGVDSAVARRGTNHSVLEVGPIELLHLIERDYAKAAPKGHVERVNHGLVQLDGRSVFKTESVLPRDASLGYYCQRMVHWMDYVRGVEVKAEIHGFDGKLQESYFYRGLDLEAPLTDRDFDPKNPGYKLK